MRSRRRELFYRHEACARRKGFERGASQRYRIACCRYGTVFSHSLGGAQPSVPRTANAKDAPIPVIGNVAAASGKQTFGELTASGDQCETSSQRRLTDHPFASAAFRMEMLLKTHSQGLNQLNPRLAGLLSAKRSFGSSVGAAQGRNGLLSFLAADSVRERRWPANPTLARNKPCPRSSRGVVTHFRSG
jgi:hypothetical protein